ncbi:hypothetical protein THAOC_22125, partial [Thalassiosira oceanica]
LGPGLTTHGCSQQLVRLTNPELELWAFNLFWLWDSWAVGVANQVSLEEDYDPSGSTALGTVHPSSPTPDVTIHTPGIKGEGGDQTPEDMVTRNHKDFHQPKALLSADWDNGTGTIYGLRNSLYSTRKVAASAGSPCPTALDSSPLGVDPFRAQRTGLESSLRPYVACSAVCLASFTLKAFTTAQSEQ